ncbi:MAG: dihydrofolate reductase [Clostridia bacterium]|nr:dihydrofolate reductase [Clostridia bacterium]
MIALIVAYDKNRVFGKDGKIPWKIEGEQKRFKELTLGNTVIMGRRTYEEIGRPLPGRQTIVISKTANFDGDNCKTVKSLDEALKIAKGDIFISGGAALYREALPFCEKLYITEIESSFDGDVFFPVFDERKYEKEVVKKISGEIPYTYLTYTKL